MKNDQSQTFDTKLKLNLNGINSVNGFNGVNNMNNLKFKIK